jgi:gluconokinase
MGVTGCGKTTFGRVLAARLGISFYDADGFHSPANIEKMSHGEPLTDADRAPWLASLAEMISRELAHGHSLVLACSALKQAYRDRLTPEPFAGRVRFIWLRITPELAERRLRARGHHYMPPSLVMSQFAALEPPTDALALDAARNPDELLQEVLDSGFAHEVG